MNHFDVFGLPPSLAIDVPALERRHRALSLELHPDRLVGKDARARLEAVSRTAALNEAFRVLRDPYRRALHLLAQKGIDLESEDPRGRSALPAEFLEEILERREALEGLMARGDRAGVGAARAEAQRGADEALTRAQGSLESGELEGAAAWLARVRYLRRFVEEADAFDEASERRGEESP